MTGGECARARASGLILYIWWLFFFQTASSARQPYYYLHVSISNVKTFLAGHVQHHRDGWTRTIGLPCVLENWHLGLTWQHDDDGPVCNKWFLIARLICSTAENTRRREASHFLKSLSVFRVYFEEKNGSFSVENKKWDVARREREREPHHHNWRQRRKKKLREELRSCTAAGRSSS